MHLAIFTRIYKRMGNPFYGFNLDATEKAAALYHEAAAIAPGSGTDTRRSGEI
jgi:hypothetical protein